MDKLNARWWALSLLSLVLAACSPVRAEGVAPTPEIEVLPAGEPAVVASVEVEIGVGSPIPVLAVISTSFPDPCAQFEFIRVSGDGSNFDVTVMTSPADAACATPFGTLPTRLEVPLNVAGLEHGTYTVTVNGGTSATFDYPPAAQ